MLQLNPQQQAVMDWAEGGTGSLNLIARAGCGKSTVLCELARRIKGRVFMGAFNKAIAEELKGKIGPGVPNVTAGTMHSLGFSIWRSIHPGQSKVESRKVSNIVRAMKLYPFDIKRAGRATADAVGYAKQAGFGLPGCPGMVDEAAWTQMCDHHDIWDELPDLISPERFLKGCMRVYAASLEMCHDPRGSEIDFDDMILAPLYYGKMTNEAQAPVQYDWVLGDEWQDANEVRRMLMRWVLRPGGRGVFCGDDKQSIYGFSGATVDSLKRTKAEFNCTELPLSITYRCPKSVVALAQTWCPDITAHESAPEGVISQIHHTKFWGQEFTPEDIVLCRFTRPLVGIAKRLRAAGVPCVVEGSSGKSLVALVSKWGLDITIQQLMFHLEEWLTRERAEWKLKEREDRVEAAQEKYDMAWDLARDLEETEPVDALVGHIMDVFGESEKSWEALRLCTVHRAKGREWKRVFLIGRNEYMPSKWAKKPWELEQEDNLVYVAVTRVKAELVEVKVKAKKSREDPEWWEEGE